MEFVLYFSYSALMHLVACLFLMFHTTTALSASPGSVTPSICHKDDMSELLEFKNSFTIPSFDALFPITPHSKLESWKVEPNNQTASNCCSWDGVGCDKETGRVIALNLHESNLVGSIQSNSSLFRLVHLQSIDLGSNSFSNSSIPSGFGMLSGLTHLHLSDSFFSGQIPLDIFTLSSLVSLDLSDNFLELTRPGFTSLVKNLANLQFLNLQGVNILSSVPDTLANMSSLRSLTLSSSGVHGVLPASIFHLPNLEDLILEYNGNLTILLPEFNSTSPLKRLMLDGTRLLGMLPTSIGNLQSLEILELGVDNCNLTGSIPSSIGRLHHLHRLSIRVCNLTGSIPSSFSNLTELTTLELSSNPFTPQNISSLSWLWKLNKVEIMLFEGMNLQGEIPSSIGNMSQLSSFEFSNNQLTGAIPSQLMNLKQLVEIRLADNDLSGHLPSWLSNMTKLSLIDLAFNRLQGPVPSWITQLPNLMMCLLSWNQLNGTAEQDLSSYLNSSSHSVTNTNPLFFHLGLASCNLREFPRFLQSRPNLEWLDLSHNNLHGEVPTWMHDIGIEGLFFLNISDNKLKGFNPTLKFLPWNALGTLDLTSNLLESVPALPPSSGVQYYLAAKNKLTGVFPPWICHWSSLVVLDLSFNNLSGTLPECLGNISTSLIVLNLQGNRFTGNLPQFFPSVLQLKMIALGQNHLSGQLPRSLANCSQLEFIDFRNNQINDTFPFWLESLPELKVLVLSHNKLHGLVDTPGPSSGFKSLRIVDLSHNAFTGVLPEEFFQTLSSMKFFGTAAGEMAYLQTSSKQPAYLASTYYGSYDFFMTLTLANKGLDMYYQEVSEMFTAINLAGNKFEGGIPDVIGDLKQLHSLNLSDNFLSGGIPPSMGNLSVLESLDLSLNKLSGEIPQALAKLNFLGVLDLSHNNLSGEIPRGTQLDTFHDSSFVGNPGLCGDYISKKCNPETPKASPSAEEQDSDLLTEFDWKIVLMGYGSGLVIGGVIGIAFTPQKYGWFSELIARIQRKRRRQTWRRHSN